MKREILVKVKSREFTCYAQKPLVTGDVQAYEVVMDTPYDLTGAVFVVSAKRADGAVVTGSGTVSGYTARATLYTNMYSVAGETVLHLTLSKDGSTLTECELVCTVVEGHGDADIAGDDRVPILTSLIAQTSQAVQQATEAAQACEEAAARVPEDPIAGEAPIDGLGYVRRNAAWSLPTKADVGLEGGNVSLGQNASANMSSVAVGSDTFAQYQGTAVGDGAMASYGAAAVGQDTFAYMGGGAIGRQARAGAGFAAGLQAKTVDAEGAVIDAIQLGTGTNNTEGTFQVYSYQLMDASGKIPAERLPSDAPVSQPVQTALDGKVDKVSGKELSTNDYTTAEKNKLSGIEAGANNYTHPATHPASMITGLPDALPNPNTLTFTGAATATYDGSSAVTVNIPEGGGGGISDAPNDGKAYVRKNQSWSQATNADVGLSNIIAPNDGYVQIGYGASANTEYGEAIAIGNGAEAQDSSIAIGSGAMGHAGGAAIGVGAYADDGGAMGNSAETIHGGAVGGNTVSVYGFAGGYQAKATADDCIQLGEGTNNTDGTFQVYSYQLLDASGKIPADRVTQSGTWTPKIVSSTANAPTITYNRQVGDWIRIGNMVWCNFTIWMASFSAGSADGSIVLGGLPFTPYGDLGRMIENITYTAYLNAASGVTTYEFLQKETNGIALIKRSAGGGGLYCKYASDSGIFNNNTEFAGSLCYRIA